MCPVNYGLEGIRVRNYRVYIANNILLDGSVVGVAYEIFLMLTEIDAFDYVAVKTEFETALIFCQPIGELRKDSIESNIADGDSVEGNEAGKIVFGKNCSFSAELINAIPDNLNALAGLDGTETLVILEEIDGRTGFVDNTVAGDNLLVSQDLHEIILIMNCNAIRLGAVSGIGKNLSISEKITGSAIPIATMLIEDGNANGASGFRTILDLPYSVADALAIAEDSKTTTEIHVDDETTVVIADGYYVDVSTYSDFRSTITGFDRVWIKMSEDGFRINGLEAGTRYYIRAFASLNGAYISSVSNTLDITTNNN